jgi:hypothetical protein
LSNDTILNSVKAKITEDISSHQKAIDELQDANAAIERGECKYKVIIKAEDSEHTGSSDYSIDDALGCALNTALSLPFGDVSGKVSRFVEVNGRLIEAGEIKRGVNLTF